MAQIYIRNEQGIIEYKGENHMSEDASLAETYGMVPDHLMPEAESVELTGWPHRVVEWHGNLGFGRN